MNRHFLLVPAIVLLAAACAAPTNPQPDQPGIVAAIAGQPWGVVALLMISGAVMATVFRASLPAARRAYAEAELRRMRAMDTP